MFLIQLLYKTLRRRRTDYVYIRARHRSLHTSNASLGRKGILLRSNSSTGPTPRTVQHAAERKGTSSQAMEHFNKHMA